MENQPQRTSSAAAQWIEAHRPWVAGVALVGALSMTVLWSIIVPETTNQASGLRWFILLRRVSSRTRVKRSTRGTTPGNTSPHWELMLRTPG